MKIEQRYWSPQIGWHTPAPIAGLNPQLVLVFCDIPEPRRSQLLADLRQCYPHATHVGCSSAGEIWDDLVHTESFCATAIEFADSHIETRTVSLKDIPDFALAGRKLVGTLPREGLRHCLILSDGMHVGVSKLIESLHSVLPDDVSITGGLAGDGPRFNTTWVLSGQRCVSDCIVAIGFYGSTLRIGSGSVGGWDPFGPDRVITRADGHVLYELDGQPALALYEKYLGSYAAAMPASGLLFPLSVRENENSPSVVRTLLGFDREAQSVTFAGDIPTGGYASLMKANFDRLVDGAASAAKSAGSALSTQQTSLALLISCVGRRLVLDQRVDEEIEAARHELGSHAAITGFYSYGEIAPAATGARCQFHNQTMTITTIQEV